MNYYQEYNFNEVYIVQPQKYYLYEGIFAVTTHLVTYFSRFNMHPAHKVKIELHRTFIQKK